MVHFAESTPGWHVNLSRVLSQSEIEAVISDLAPRSHSNHQSLVKLVIFRLSVFCGLRATEICGLNLSDVSLDPELPMVYVGSDTAKGGKPREVPILSPDTVADLKRWKQLRLVHGANPGDTFLCSLSSDTLGHRFSRQSARNRFRAACKCLGKERAEGLTIHDGRHTCASMSLHKRVPIALVRDMLGHSSIAITNTYVGLFRDGKGIGYNLD